MAKQEIVDGIEPISHQKRAIITDLCIVGLSAAEVLGLMVLSTEFKHLAAPFTSLMAINLVVMLTAAALFKINLRSAQRTSKEVLNPSNLIDG